MTQAKADTNTAAAHLLTEPGAPQFLAAQLTLPYTLTTGKAVGSVLTALADRRILGSRPRSGGRTVAPAQDYCADTGEQTELVEVGTGGVVTALTTTPEQTLLMVTLDGADGPMLHRLVGPLDGVQVGTRVRAVWADTPEGTILDLVGFEVGGEPSSPSTEVVELDEPMAEQPYRLELNYQHSYGPFYGRLFDELAGSRRLLGSPCPVCHRVQLPPRERCDVCFAKTTRLVEVADSGTLKGFSIIHLEFVGQTQAPPYVYAEIELDGCHTRLIHNVGGIDIDTAKDTLSVGMKVQAVWREGEPQGSLNDIEYFAPLP